MARQAGVALPLEVLERPSFLTRRGLDDIPLQAPSCRGLPQSWLAGPLFADSRLSRLRQTMTSPPELHATPGGGLFTMKTSHTGARLRLSDTDGFAHEFTAFWLREASTNPEHRDVRTGHKLKDADRLALDVMVVSVQENGDALALQFSDGHSAEYSLRALRRAAEQPYTHELLGEKKLLGSAPRQRWGIAKPRARAPGLVRRECDSRRIPIVNLRITHPCVFEASRLSFVGPSGHPMD